eukprot:scaffold331885_cov30-Prasinocladus_malaysianus.AAC.1
MSRARQPNERHGMPHQPGTVKHQSSLCLRLGPNVCPGLPKGIPARIRGWRVRLGHARQLPAPPLPEYRHTNSGDYVSDPRELSTVLQLYWPS